MKDGEKYIDFFSRCTEVSLSLYRENLEGYKTLNKKRGKRAGRNSRARREDNILFTMVESDYPGNPERYRFELCSEAMKTSGIRHGRFIIPYFIEDFQGEIVAGKFVRWGDMLPNDSKMMVHSHGADDKDGKGSYIQFLREGWLLRSFPKGGQCYINWIACDDAITWTFPLASQTAKWWPIKGRKGGNKE